MTNGKKRLGVLSLVLVFGVVGIVNINAQTDNRLNGTWVALTVPDETLRIAENAYRQAGFSNIQIWETISEVSAAMLKQETRMNNGNWETVVDGIPNARGTFSTGNGQLTTRTTHMHGAPIGLEARWYTVDELRRTLRNMGIPDSMLNAIFSLLALEEIPSNYSVTANTLTTSHPVGGQTVSTRR